MTRITEIEQEQPVRLNPFIEDIHKLLSRDQLGPEWAGMVWYVLARLERALRVLLDPDNNPTGPESEVDHTRESLLRRHKKLTQVQHNLVERCQALKWEAFRANQPCTEEPLGKMPPLHSLDGCLSPDYHALKQRLHAFVLALEARQHEEVSLVLESVTTDLGAGD
jgi:hypothetical protein